MKVAQAIYRRARNRLAFPPQPYVRQKAAELRCAFENIDGDVRGRRVGPGSIGLVHGDVLWAIVERLQPLRVVETGVCNGLSSAVLLKAMAGRGELVSIDMPEFSDGTGGKFWEGKGGAVVPAGRQAGWLVEGDPPNWRLLLGRTSELLPAVLAEGPVDLFIHDSEHSFDNQLFEFNAGWQALRPGGVLVATDINWSEAFDVFRRRIGPAKLTFIDSSFCLVEKQAA